MLSTRLVPQHSTPIWSFQALNSNENDDDDIEVLSVKPAPSVRAHPPPNHRTSNNVQNGGTFMSSTNGIPGQKRKPILEIANEADQLQRKKPKLETDNRRVQNRLAPGNRDDLLQTLLRDITPPPAAQKSTAAPKLRPTETQVASNGPTQHIRVERSQAEHSSPQAFRNPHLNAQAKLPVKQISSGTGVPSTPPNTPLPTNGANASPQQYLNPPAARSGTIAASGTAGMPFLVDDDTLDDRAPVPARNSTLYSKPVVSPFEARPDAAQRERQRLESRRFREETLERKRRSTSKAESTLAGSEDASQVNGVSRKSSATEFQKSVVPPHQSGLGGMKTQGMTEEKAQVSDQPQNVTSIPKTESPLSYPGSKTEKTPANKVSKPETVDIKPITLADHLSGTKMRNPVSTQGSAPVVSDPGNASKPSAQEREEERRNLKRKENTQKQNEQLRAQIKEAERQAEQEQQEHAAKRAEESRRAEEEKQAAAEKEAETKRRADFDARRHSHPQKGTDQGREVEARRRAQEKATKQAEHERREFERRQAEEREFAEAKRAREAQQEALTKRAEEAKREESAIAEREKALARLTCIPKPTSTGKGTVQPSQVQNATKENAGMERLPVPQRSGHHTMGAGKVETSTSLEQHTPAPIAPKGTNERANLLVAQQKSDSSSQIEPIGGAHAGAAREQRIQAMRDRNARLQRAEDDEPSECQPETAKAPSSEFPPKGPVSLNSTEGQARLARSNAVSSRIQPTKATSTSACAQNENNRDQVKNHQRQLGEILQEDIRLYRRRSTGSTFKEVLILLEKCFGWDKSVDTLRKRYKQVKEAILAANVDPMLIDHADGNEAARQEVNRKIHGTWPLPPTEKLRDANGHYVAVVRPSSQSSPNAGGWDSPASGLSFESKTLSGSLVSSPLQDNVGGQPRPHTGGKTMTQDVLHYYLQGFAEQQARDSEDVAPERESSPVTEEDYCHFAYQVECRQVSKEELDDEVRIGDAQWDVCCGPFDNLLQANIAATNRIFRVPKGWRSAVDLSEGHKMETRKLEGDMEFHELIGTAGGIRQVQVTRYLRTHQDGILPQNKNGWVPKTIYFVRQKTVTKSGDDIFEESKEESIEENVDNTVYTTLDLANECAAKKFIDEAFEPESRHLTQRQIEIQRAVKQVLDELDESEEEMFSRAVESEDGTKVVEVWVEEGRLAGPRNLY